MRPAIFLSWSGRPLLAMNSSEGRPRQAIAPSTAYARRIAKTMDGFMALEFASAYDSITLLTALASHQPSFPSRAEAEFMAADKTAVDTSPPG
ncbi:MAG: hypothetical protein M1457_14140 [bacterium]|nr:hypothetical protein [bacterium]